MKSLFRLFKLSSALDDGKPAADLQQIARGEEAGAFAHDLARLDHHLKTEPPEVRLPDSLHASIMTAIHSQSVSEPAGVRGQSAGSLTATFVLQHRAPWWAAPACAAILVACLWAATHLVPQSAPRSSLTNVTKDLADLPGTVLSPLSGELENLNRDLENTADFLLASVP